jgi:hypothetical protein
MKKLIAVCMLGLSAVSVWAQGQVNFINGGAAFLSVANRYVYQAGATPNDAVLGGFPDALGSDSNGRLTGTSWVAGLWYLSGAGHGAEIGTAAQAGRTFAFRTATTARQNQGVWLVPIGASSLFDLANVANGAFATLQVRVWDGAKYSSFDAAVAGGEYGQSLPFDYKAPVAGELNPGAYLMDGLRAFAIVPEPSTIVLGLLGVAGLLAFRSRK